METILFSVMTGAIVVTSEVLMKSSSEWRWWVFGPIAFFQSYLFWRILQLSPNFVSAFIYFTCTTAALRIVASVIMHKPIGAGSWGALALMLVASWLRYWKP